MAHWCESCGQEVPESEAHHDATWLGDASDHQYSFARPAGVKKSGRDKRLLLVVAAVLAAWGLFVGLGRVVTPDDGIDQQAAAEIEEARLEREARAAAELEEAEREREAAQAEPEDVLANESAEAVAIAEVAGDYGAADAAPGFPVGDSNVGARAAVSVPFDRLQRQLSRRDTAAFVAYRSTDGIVVLDLEKGQPTVTQVAPGTSPMFPGDYLLRSGNSTYAIDPETRRVARVAENSSLVVSDTPEGDLYVIDSAGGSGQGAIIEVVADGEYGFHRVPTEPLQLRPIDGLGVLAVSQQSTGQTLIAGVDSFTTLSQYRVLAATPSALLEQVCLTEDQCGLTITSLATGDQHEVPASFVRAGDEYSLSPDGQSLLRHSREGFAEVYIAETETILWVVGSGMRSPAWSPNSDFITWIDRTSEPSLTVMFPDDRDWLTIELRDLAAPAPASPELIVFTTDQVAFD